MAGRVVVLGLGVTGVSLVAVGKVVPGKLFCSVLPCNTGSVVPRNIEVPCVVDFRLDDIGTSLTVVLLFE
jgi:hypothetical protein